jgi:dTDP-4-amino-4,6-dideoxygalactose transaminase
MGEDRIVFGAPVVDEEDVRAVVETLRSGWLGPGPQTERLEQEFGTFVGGREALALTSCTGALHLALLALGLRPGDEVITSPLTWPATANTIVRAGGRPVFVDVRRDGTIDPEHVERVVGPRTRAVLPVHYAGMPSDLDVLGDIARRHGLVLVQDAAHAIEARWRGRPLGSFGTATYSFYATKNLATGEGGMLVSDHPDLVARCRLLSQHGVTRNAWNRFADGNLAPYDVVEPGLNYAMPDILASLGRSQLRKLPRWHRRRAELAQAYGDLLLGGPVELLPEPPDHAVHAHHLYPVLAGGRQERDAMREHLHQARIGTGVHFAPVHLLTWYRERFGFAPGDLPVAEDLGARTLSLPLSPALRDSDVERIAKRVMDW